MLDYHFVTDRLAVGGSIGTVERMQELAAAGITHVVNLQAEFDDRAITGETGVKVLWIECDDDFQAKPAELFREAVAFVQEALQDPKAQVLFHCAAGIHRSPMMLLAVLRVLGWESQRAIQGISSVRPQVDFPEIYLSSVEEFVQEYRAMAESAAETPAPGSARS